MLGCDEGIKLGSENGRVLGVLLVTRDGKEIGKSISPKVGNSDGEENGRVIGILDGNVLGELEIKEVGNSDPSHQWVPL